eukprot:UN09341
MFLSDNFDFSRRMLINIKTPFRNSRFKTNNSKIFLTICFEHFRVLTHLPTGRQILEKKKSHSIL